VRLPDVNLLLYAVNRDAVQFPRARPWLEGRLQGTETMAFAWATLTGFLRLSTRPGIFAAPLSAAAALDLVDSWLELRHVTVVQPTELHAATLRALIEQVGTAGNLVTDAHLAALAIEHGATLESADHDFGRFPGLRWEDPLMDPPQSRRR
jgi:toxin-antitoxin system PIN domain toxin